MGPRFVLIKKGEHGSMMVTDQDDVFVLPAFPADKVVDPTGAGDSFAGGLMGYLSTQGTFSPATVKRAMAFGTVVASYTISDFSLGPLQKLDRDQIDERWHEFRRAMTFGAAGAEATRAPPQPLILRTLPARTCGACGRRSLRNETRPTRSPGCAERICTSRFSSSARWRRLRC